MDAVEAVKKMRIGSAKDQEEAVETIRYLAYRGTDEDKVALFRTPGLVPALSEVLRTRTGIAQEKAVSAIAELALAEANRVPLFEAPGLLSGLVEVLRTRTGFAQQYAVFAIAHLASVDANRVPLFEAPGLLSGLVEVLQNGPSGAQGIAVSTITQLASVDANKVPLFEAPGLVTALVEAGGENAFEIIKKLAEATEIRAPLFEKLAEVLRSDSADAQEQAAGVILKLEAYDALAAYSLPDLMSDLGEKRAQLLVSAFEEHELDAAFDQVPPARRRVSVLEAARKGKYDACAQVKDTGMPLVDISFDGLSRVTFFLHRRYQYLLIMLSAMLCNTIATSIAMLAFGKHPLEVGLNMITFGIYGFVSEAVECKKQRRKTDLLYFFKLFESFESATAFLVTSYSLFVAGELEGYEELVGFSLVARWGSVASSLVTLPLCAMDFYQRQINRYTPDELQHYKKAVRSGIPKLVHAFSCFAEVASLLGLVAFGFATRPYGILCLFGAQYLILVAFTAIDTLGKTDELILSFLGASLVALPLSIFQALPSYGDSMRVIRAGAVLRVAVLAVAWGVLLLSRHAVFIHEADDPSTLALLLIGAFGAIAVPLCFLYQVTLGRFGDTGYVRLQAADPPDEEPETYMQVQVA